MNPFKSIRKWKRKDWDEPKEGKDLERRKYAEKEADHDLQKSIQQFLADVHEEAEHPWPEKPYDEKMTLSESRIVASLLKIVGLQKRTTALLVVNAHESSVTNWWLKWLTFFIFILTLALVWKEFCPHNTTQGKNTDNYPNYHEGAKAGEQNKP